MLVLHWHFQDPSPVNSRRVFFISLLAIAALSRNLFHDSPMPITIRKQEIRGWRCHHHAKQTWDDSDLQAYISNAGRVKTGDPSPDKNCGWLCDHCDDSAGKYRRNNYRVACLFPISRRSTDNN